MGQIMAEKHRPTGRDPALGLVPRETCRFTRKEAGQRGVSYSAKRRVDTTVKRVTSKTKLYTDRQVGTAKIRRSTGLPKATLETFARERKARSHTENLIVI
jgi:hypothetical protein